MSTSKKKKILFFAEGVSLAHPTRIFQLALSLDQKEYEIHFATTLEMAKYLDFKTSAFTFHQISSIPISIFNSRLFRTQFPFQIDELNAFAQEDQKLVNHVKPDLVVTDFRLSYKAIWKKNAVPWLNLIQYHWHPQYSRPKMVPTILPVKIFGRTLTEMFSSLVEPIILKSQMSTIEEFEKLNSTARSSSIFEFYSSGDHLIFPDCAELFEMPKVGPAGTFIGPILWKNSKEFSRPPEWLDASWNDVAEKKVVYVSMGSTGPQYLNDHFVDALLSLNYRIYISDARMNNTDKFVQSKDVRRASFLPADAILKECDLQISNGGTGTTYHALSYGVPAFAVPSNLDQCLHVEVLKRNNLGDFLFCDTFKKELFIQKILNLESDLTLRSAIANSQSQILQYSIDNLFEKTVRRFI